MGSEEERKREYHGRLERIFQSLHALGSPEYLSLLETASARELPAQVLVRAYRQLCKDKTRQEAAKRTLERLLGHEEKYGYLSAVRRLAGKRLSRYDRANEVEDLVRGTALRILEALPGSQGGFAEQAWVKFCEQQFEQAWRDLYGRTGIKAKVEFVEPVRDDETGLLHVHAEESDAAEAPWHTVMERPDEVIQLMLDRARSELLREEIASWGDPNLRAVALDQFIEDCGPVSGSRTRSNKAPLTKRLGLGRDEINRLIKKARLRLKAALLAHPEYVADLDALRARSPAGPAKQRSRR
jgi:hypothetical protein